MGFAPKHSISLDRLEHAVRQALKPRGDLFSKIIASACTRVPALEKSEQGRSIRRLIEAEAWIEAALALVEFELPGWQVAGL